MKAPKLVKVDSFDIPDGMGYVLLRSDDYALICMPPQEKGQCLCIIIAEAITTSHTSYKQTETADNFAYFNFGASAIKTKIIPRLQWIYKHHERNKPLKK